MDDGFLIKHEAVTQRFLIENKQLPRQIERTSEFILRPLRLLFRPAVLYFQPCLGDIVRGLIEKYRVTSPYAAGSDLPADRRIGCAF